MGRYITFPSTQEALNETRHGFYAVVGSSRVIQAADCSHVQNVSPSNTEHAYRNCKHSLNQQVVWDARGLVMNSRFSVLGNGEDGDAGG